MDLDPLALRVAVLKILSDRVLTAFRQAKEEAVAILGPEGRKNGSFNGYKLAAVSVSKSGRFAVHNQQAFTAWVAENYPSEVYDVPTVRPAFLDQIKKASERAGQPCAPDGTLDIPGVGIGEPYAIVRKTPEAEALVEDLWISGRLSVDGHIKEIE